MPRANEQKIKLLVLYDILQRETDEEHPLSTNEIIERLSARGIEVSRKILLDDGNTHIVYDGAEYIPVACGKTSGDLHSVAVLKKMCSPAQQFFCSGFCKARKRRVLRGYYRGNDRFSRCGGTV